MPAKPKTHLDKKDVGSQLDHLEVCSSTPRWNGMRGQAAEYVAAAAAAASAPTRILNTEGLSVDSDEDGMPPLVWSSCSSTASSVVSSSATVISGLPSLSDNVYADHAAAHVAATERTLAFGQSAFYPMNLRLVSSRAYTVEHRVLGTLLVDTVVLMQACARTAPGPACARTH